MNIRNIDLNLLIIFRSLMVTLSVSKTAEEMNLSQPAVSHALNRLRKDLSDDLLVRSSRSMVATPYALELEGKIIQLLNQLESALTRKTFDPKTLAAKVRIQTTEYFEQLIMPTLLEYFAEHAPHLQLIITSTSGRLPTAELRQNECDLAIAGFFGPLPEGLFQQKTFKDRLVCLCSSKIAGKVGSKISLENYLSFKHIYISPEGRLSGAIDRFLTKQKKKREVIASISGFSAPAKICQSKQFSCTLPQKLAQQYAESPAIKWFELPFDTQPIQVVQVWHERTQRDPLSRFVRAAIAEVCSRI
ncbi:MAG: LysR family transcriptional regulator [Bdellovibrionales bacterium]|nr:LysR family transcriptional regulator [Bdellovibrionales bacterium]